ncbi:LuxR C-terminal-related transcriptional regulator [Microbacterium sp. NPDC089695]|uniref:LuxR C-terminal-related transcriptional regulator n=1 Tax=Microbacterium sp. NPDC089695 TaxID=3364198 RepID=UPI00382C8137
MHAADTPSLAVVQPLLGRLLDEGFVCAPHVVARLVVMLDGHEATVRQVVARLDPSERAARRPLPDPLPLVPAIVDSYAALRVGGRERELLVAAAMSRDDRVAPLIAAHDADADVISSHLHVHAGRFRFRDPRLAVWLAGTASAAELRIAHARLERAAGAEGDAITAAWHRARASALGDADAADVLVRAAYRRAREGDDERALQCAAEAAAHGEGADRDAARVVAGVAALGAGYAAEAVGWLTGVLTDAEERSRLRGLAAVILAHTLLQGAVPDVDPARFRPTTDAREDWLDWTRAAAFAAALSAERGDRQRTRGWLDALREGAERADARRELRDPVVSLVWLLLGEGDPDDAGGDGAVTGALFDALRLGVGGRIDEGLRLLTTRGIDAVDSDDPFVAGFGNSALIEAYRVVTEVLLRVWRGEIADARLQLHRASLTVPIALPFAGLGVVLARRLDLAVLGRLGPFARSLTAMLPSAARADQLIDRAIRAHLAGDLDDAAAFVRLWLDRGAPQPVFSVPGLDEHVPLGVDLASAGRDRVEPPESALGRLLRQRSATSADAIWRREAADAADDARSIESPFERARVEAALGTRAIIGGDVSLGRRHLRTAQRLFDESGATAWAGAVARQLRHVPGEDDDTAAADPAPTAMRRRWAGVLTARELDVALRVVQGLSNRDIAAEMSVSVRTVEVHLGRVFAKVGVRNRVDLVLLAHRTARHG